MLLRHLRQVKDERHPVGECVTTRGTLLHFGVRELLVSHQVELEHLLRLERLVAYFAAELVLVVGLLVFVDGTFANETLRALGALVRRERPEFARAILQRALAHGKDHEIKPATVHIESFVIGQHDLGKLELCFVISIPS